MKKFDFYVIKDKALWLSQEYDDLHNETIDNTPKFAFVLALDWWKGRERPSSLRFSNQPDRDYYSSFHVRFYLLFFQICAIVRLNKLPYRNKAEYYAWRNDNV